MSQPSAQDLAEQAAVARRRTWGKQLADSFDAVFSTQPADSCPDLSHIIQVFRVSGISHDPQPIINSLQNAFQDPGTQSVLHMLDIVNVSLGSRIDANNRAHEYTNNLRASLHEAEIEAEKYKAVVEQDQVWIKQLQNFNLAQSARFDYRRKTKDPEKFTGEATTTEEIIKRQEEYMAWKKSIQLTFLRDQNHFPNKPSDEVFHIIGLLGGQAWTNNSVYIDAVIAAYKDPSNPFDTDARKWETSAKILNELDSQYITIDLKLTDGLLYDDLAMQDKKTGKITPFPQFLARFKSLAASTGKTDEQMVTDFQKKVSESMAKQFVLIENAPADDDINGWAARASKLWDKQLVFEHNHRKGKSKTQQKPSQQQSSHQQSSSSKTTSNGGDMMDLDQMHLRALSKAKKDYCRANDLCYYCQDPGHEIGDCDKKKLADKQKGKKGGRGNTPRGGGQSSGSFGQGGGGFGAYGQHPNFGGQLRYSSHQFPQFPGMAPNGFPLMSPSSYPGSVYPPSSYPGSVYPPSTYAPSAYGSGSVNGGPPPPSPIPQPFAQHNAQFHRNEFRSGAGAGGESGNE